jgi:hypothetical protein
VFYFGLVLLAYWQLSRGSVLQAINEAGGSLMLAVLNGTVIFPTPDSYPEELRSLVNFCLDTNPATRPFVEDIIARVQDLLIRCPAVP